MQNRINLALPLLPDVVKQAGVTTRKRSPDILLVIAIYSPNGRYDQLYLSNFTTIKIKDEVARVEGVGDCIQFGQQDYSMRIWVDPDKLAALNLTALDVANALREQNKQVAAGHIAQQPTPTGQPYEFTITALGRLSDPADYEDIVIRTDSQGRRSTSRTSAASSSAPQYGHDQQGGPASQRQPGRVGAARGQFASPRLSACGRSWRN